MKLAEDASNCQGLLQDTCVRPCSDLSMLTMGACWAVRAACVGVWGCTVRTGLQSPYQRSQLHHASTPGAGALEPGNRRAAAGGKLSSLLSSHLTNSIRPPAMAKTLNLPPRAAFGICGVPFAQALARTGNCSQLTICGEFPTWVGDWKLPLACWPARCTMLGLRQ